jgi:hypothetical protein
MAFYGRKLLTACLLAYYGGIALVGHGLHELSGANCHHPPVAARPVASHPHPHHQHGACAGHHHHHRAPAPAGDTAGDGHNCEICEFLAQLRGEVPQLAAAEFTEHLVVAAVAASPPFLAPIAIGLHAPRGPPALVG